MELIFLEKKKRGIIIIAILIVAGGVIYFMTNASYFRLKKVTVAGNQNLGKEVVIGLSELKVNNNIFRSNTGKAKKNISKNPYVEDIKVTRKLPDTINIVISEISETYQIPTEDKSHIILDANGNILNYKKSPSKNVTVIKGLKFNKKINEKSIGTNISEYGENDKIFKYLKSSSELNLPNEIREINFNKNNIDIILKNNKLVKFGNFKNYEYKLKLLKEVLKKTAEEKINYETIFMDRGENPIIVTDGASL